MTETKTQYGDEIVRAGVVEAQEQIAERIAKAGHGIMLVQGVILPGGLLKDLEKTIFEFLKGSMILTSQIENQIRTGQSRPPAA